MVDHVSMLIRLMKIAIKGNYLVYLLFFIVIFISTFIIIESRFKKESAIETKKLAQLFATPLWRFDVEAIRYYLLLTIENDDYRKVAIIDSDGLVLDSESKAESKINNIFSRYEVLSGKVYLKGEGLGYIRIHKENTNNIIYFLLIVTFIVMILFKSIYQNLKKNSLDMELLFEQSFNFNASIMSIIDINDNTFIDVNNTFLEVFRFADKKDVIGKTALELRIHFTHINVEQFYREVEADQDTSYRELTCYSSHGDELIHMATLRLVKLKGNTLALYTATDITNKKKNEARIAATNNKLIESARLAGQAEIATGVLHNVGNVLNSACVSASVVQDNIGNNGENSLSKILKYLKDSASSDERLIKYVDGVDQIHDKKVRKSKEEVDNLISHLDHIREIVKLHQSYSKESRLVELVHPMQIIDDAIKVNQGSLERHGVTLVHNSSEEEPLLLDRHRVLQILINLVSNAKYATSCNKLGNRLVEIDSVYADGNLIITVDDNGVGIPKEDIKNIFNYGFTTRKDGHGFGLHSCANVVAEVGGVIKVESPGVGRGAKFILEIPISKVDEQCA